MSQLCSSVHVILCLSPAFQAVPLRTQQAPFLLKMPAEVYSEIQRRSTKSTRRHIPEASAVRTSLLVCFRNTLLTKSAACNVIKTETSPSGSTQLPVVHPVSDTSHQLHVAVPISSVADRDVSPLNPSHPSPTDTRTAGETSAFCIQLQDVIAPREVTS
jgi:hypothetical protein